MQINLERNLFQGFQNVTGITLQKHSFQPYLYVLKERKFQAITWLSLQKHMSFFIITKIQVRLEGKLIIEKSEDLRAPFPGMKLLALSVIELEAATLGGKIQRVICSNRKKMIFL